MKNCEFYLKSASGEGDYFVNAWIPEGDVTGVLQIAHGMAEHSSRYEKFASELTNLGIAVFANDHIGHGKSQMNHRGTFALKNHGFEMVLNDMKSTFDLAENEFPGTPQALLGHSMGSVLAGIYANRKMSDVCSLILMGTPMPNPLAAFGIFLASLKVATGGYESESKLINNIMDKAMNAAGEGAEKYSWLTRDEAEVLKYYEDENCGFYFSASANREFFRGLKEFSSKFWGKNIAIPTLVIAGERDAAGGNGKGPLHYYTSLKRHGNKLSTLHLIPEARHEILNELYSDITVYFLSQWLKSNLCNLQT